jgi:hypothetical protein
MKSSGGYQAGFLGLTEKSKMAAKMATKMAAPAQFNINL